MGDRCGDGVECADGLYCCAGKICGIFSHTVMMQRIHENHKQKQGVQTHNLHDKDRQGRPTLGISIEEIQLTGIYKHTLVVFSYSCPDYLPRSVPNWLFHHSTSQIVVPLHTTMTAGLQYLVVERQVALLCDLFGSHFSLVLFFFVLFMYFCSSSNFIGAVNKSPYISPFMVSPLLFLHTLAS